mgnify:CR=1 FL=1
MWWQGEDNLPAIVRLCFASMRKHCGSHRLIIITKDNYQEYITIPEHILAKVQSGSITLTYLSDIIRVNLLAKYGGLWMDSTIFVAGEIPEEIFSMEYFTIKHDKDRDLNQTCISFDRWTGYCFAARDRNNLLFSFLSDMCSEYWKNHDSLIDYLLIDYFIALPFKEFPEFHKAWQNIPVNNVNSWGLLHHLVNNELDAEKYSYMTKTTQFFKLSWKEKFNTKTSSGIKTTYGRLLSEYGITPSE